MIDDSHKKQQQLNEYKEEITKIQEIGGPKGLEPTRYGVNSPEWEVKSRVTDF